MGTKEYAPKNDKTEAKPHMDLLPIDLLRDLLCPAYEEGVAKYGRETWRQGFEASRLMAACMRHLTAYYYDGEDFDPDTNKDLPLKHHLAGAIFSLISMYHSSIHHPELDDRPGKPQAKQVVTGGDDEAVPFENMDMTTLCINDIDDIKIDSYFLKN